jgi:hypothetical protein
MNKKKWQMLTIQSTLPVREALAIAAIACEQTQQQEVVYFNQRYMVMNGNGIMTIVKKP